MTNESVISSRGTNGDYRKRVSAFKGLCTRLANIGNRFQDFIRGLREHQREIESDCSRLQSKCDEVWCYATGAKRHLNGIERSITEIKELNIIRANERAIEAVKIHNPISNPPQPVKRPKMH